MSVTDLDYALAAHGNGFAVLPPMEDGSKRPAVTWKEFQDQRPDEDQVRTWYERDRAGFGVICGEASERLEMFEIEGRAIDLWPQFRAACRNRGVGDVLNRVIDGYAEMTPSGGIHLLWRCPDGIEGNLKLARRPATTDELADDPQDKVKVLIETRGEGGYTILAPSCGTVHPTGKPWDLKKGGLDTVAVITAEERAVLLDAARTFDRLDPAPPPVTAETFFTHTDDKSWFDQVVEDYNRSTIWDEALPGWHRMNTDPKGITYWCRPGKKPRDGHSATTNSLGTDRLIVFSSAVEGFEVYTGVGKATSYDRFSAYAILEHRGDRTAAARTLRPDSDPFDLNDLLPPPATTLDGEPADVHRRMHLGGEWLSDVGETIPAVWGRDDEVLWASGEPLIIAAPPGVGKTTLAGQVVRASLLGGDVIGYPVEPTEGKLLYLACDRPRQIKRSLRRHFAAHELAALDTRLRVWEGPPPKDFGKHPECLYELCQEAGADRVVIDSLKDVAIGLTDDETGASLNRAIQFAISVGIEVMCLHHQRKGQNGTKPKTLEDVYGSTWITAGAGSVVLLWGAAGDVVVELIHLKQPAAEIGPIKLEHDHTAGRTDVLKEQDPLDIVRKSSKPVGAGDVARQIYSKNQPSENDVRKVRRRLDRLVKDGLVVKIDASSGGSGGSNSATYRASLLTSDLSEMSNSHPPATSDKSAGQSTDHAKAGRTEQSDQPDHQPPPTIFEETAGQSTDHSTNHTSHPKHQPSPPFFNQGGGGAQTAPPEHPTGVETDF